jgi:hypothetical protein
MRPVTAAVNCFNTHLLLDSWYYLAIIRDELDTLFTYLFTQKLSVIRWGEEEEQSNILQSLIYR